MVFTDYTAGPGRIYLGDCLKILPEIPDGVIDMILCDLPYGTTGNKWDTIIPFEDLWKQYWRIGKPNAAIVLTAAQPFTSALVMSQVKYFKYDWTWRKQQGTGHLNAKKMPLRDKEDILVFYRQQCLYNPQWSQGTPWTPRAGKQELQQTSSYGAYGTHREGSDGKRYPKQIIEFQTVGRDGIHPTQKPTDLFEYLIKTYTIENDIVLDNCIGSGTTAIAAINTKRRWVGIEKEEGYYNAACERIKNHQMEIKQCAE